MATGLPYTPYSKSIQTAPRCFVQKIRYCALGLKGVVRHQVGVMELNALILLLFSKAITIIVLAVTCMSVLAYATRPVIVFLLFQWFSEFELPMAQSYIGEAAWLSAIIGYLFSGYSLQHFGLTNTLLTGTAIAALAICILHFSIKPTANYLTN